MKFDWQVGTNDSVPPAKEVTQHMLCSQGEHYLILDEEIGMICKYCPHVHQEIKYIVPEFVSPEIICIHVPLSVKIGHSSTRCFYLCYYH